jgi:hypothetical protein
MVNTPSLVTITQAEIMELCTRLGHDPARVARITIEPHVVVVEYEHPITGVDPSSRLDVVQHMTIKAPPPAKPRPWPGDPAPDDAPSPS